MPRLIKRYRNRKLYDTERSSYVTLDDIGEMVKAGEDIQIIDQKSGEDLTNVTLAQIILEEQKRAADEGEASELPRSALQNLVQSSGELFQKLSSPVTRVGDDLKRRAEMFEEQRQATFRELVETTQRRVDEAQRRFDERIKDAVDQLTHIPNLRRDLRDARRRVDQLEGEVKMLRGMVEELGERVHATGGPPSLPAQKSNPTLAV